MVAINGCKLKFGAVEVQAENQAQLTGRLVAVAVVHITQLLFHYLIWLRLKVIRLVLVGLL
jgi:hypothetical protein